MIELEVNTPAWPGALSICHVGLFTKSTAVNKLAHTTDLIIEVSAKKGRGRKIGVAVCTELLFVETINNMSNCDGF